MTKIRIEVEVDLTVDDLKKVIAEHLEYPPGTKVNPIDAIVALLGGTLDIKRKVNVSEFVPKSARHSIGVERIPGERFGVPANHRYAVVERYEGEIVKICITGVSRLALNDTARYYANTYGATYVEV